MERLSGTLDKAFAALIDDRKDRGLLNDTLIVCQGEFGRTPKINGNKDRDHWPASWSAVLAGGGIKTGQVVGKTSPDGMAVESDPTRTADFVATVATRRPSTNSTRTRTDCYPPRRQRKP